ncbi:TonB-dependent receptor [Catalinimonas niigatensis]|uniref:TonB-dependent receptor n=1 Tax=Catalinimonas niigatensis TaxID=1397264 RepID=UPI002664EA4D|nr:TonB-dependent receptor [Catalinimonas niigatensis]WPP52559.1 TonB-dependent receptor [Catalinimonas niigatensis]
MKKIYCIALLGILSGLISHQLYAQSQYTISGYVKDASNGEALIGATVSLGEKPGTGTVTNVYGFYSLTLPQDNYTINYSYLGYQPNNIKFLLQSDTTINVELGNQEVELQEVIISADRPEDNFQDVKMSREELKIEKIKSLPALFGEVDVLRTVQLLPGVQSAGEGTTGLFVRGGSADQNLVLLDEATVFNPSHFLGFFSVFNPDAIKNLEIYKGGIPARFGGRLSSILDIQMKEGNNKRFNVSGGIGSISSRLTVEGPIKKNQSSFILSGRRTYADLFLKLSGDEAIRNNTLYFYDFNAKANYQFNNRHKLFVSGYFGRDRFGIADEFGLNWGNATATTRWNYLISDQLFLNTTFIYSNFDYGFDIDTEVAEFTWKSKLRELSGKMDFNFFPNPKNSVDFGYHVHLHKFAPPSIIPSGDTNFAPLILDDKFALEQALYVSNQQQVSERISLEYGLRYSVFQQVGPGTVFLYEEGQPLSDETIVDTEEFTSGESIKLYHGIEPRFSARYLITGNSSFKTSYNRMRQYLQVASNATAGLPIDRWIPADRYVKPLIGDQIAAGYFHNFASNTLEASVEVYYKWMQNVIDFKSGSDILLNNNIETEISAGRGWAYGAEFLLRKNVGKTTGWISYTLSRTRRQIDGINGGRAYNARYDRVHDISLVASHQLNPRLVLSGTWVYSTGLAVSLPSGRYPLDGQSVPYYDPNGRNAYRMPDFHRLDLSVVLEGKKKEGRRWNSSWSFSVYNAYAQKNPFVITFENVYNEDPDFDLNGDEPVETVRPAAIKTYLFSIIPSVTYNFKF